MGPNPGQSRVKAQSYDPVFESIIRDTGVVPIGNRAAAEGEEEKKSEPARQSEESKATPAASVRPDDDGLILARMAGEFP